MVQHVLDAGFFGAGGVALFGVLTPALTFLTLLATTIWAVFRIYLLVLEIRVKRAQLKDLK